MSQTPSPHPPRPDVPQPWNPRFGIGGMLLVMLVFSVMAAAGGYLVRVFNSGRSSKLTFILFTLASPVVLLFVVSVVYHLAQWRRSRRRVDAQDDELRP